MDLIEFVENVKHYFVKFDIKTQIMLPVVIA